jgi:hypothetical protein
MSAMPQKMQRAQILLGEACPSLVVNSRPQIAGPAASEALASIVDFDQLLPTVMAATHAASFARGYDRMKGARFGGHAL